MINISFYIRNPWSKDLSHHDYFYYHKKISKNKSFETQIYRSSVYNLLGLRLDFSWTGEDHAGPSLDIEFWKYNFNIKIYDHRHWDYETGSWEVYEEKTND